MREAYALICEAIWLEISEYFSIQAELHTKPVPYVIRKRFRTEFCIVVLLYKTAILLK
jgi:hypothetical protein